MSDCLFCKIVEKKIPAAVVYEDEEVLAFSDIAPQAPIHILLIPKKHFASLTELAKTETPLLAALMRAIPKIVEQQKIAEEGFRVVVNQGALAGQAVAHVHFHILGGRRLRWPPG